MSKPFVFSPEQHNRTMEMLEQKITLRSIAEEMGCSPKRLQNHLKEHRIRTALGKVRERAKEQRAKKPVEKEPKTPQQSPQKIIEPTSSDYKMRLITLLEKKPYDCSWIIGDPKKNYRYCGNTTLGSKSTAYCEYHAEISCSKQKLAHKPYAPVN